MFLDPLSLINQAGILTQAAASEHKEGNYRNAFDL
jgi:hypothetical protein